MSSSFDELQKMFKGINTYLKCKIRIAILKSAHQYQISTNNFL